MNTADMLETDPEVRRALHASVSALMRRAWQPLHSIPDAPEEPDQALARLWNVKIKWPNTLASVLPAPRWHLLGEIPSTLAPATLWIAFPEGHSTLILVASTIPVASGHIVTLGAGRRCSIDPARYALTQLHHPADLAEALQVAAIDADIDHGKCAPAHAGSPGDIYRLNLGEPHRLREDQPI